MADSKNTKTGNAPGKKINQKFFITPLDMPDGRTEQPAPSESRRSTEASVYVQVHEEGSPESEGRTKNHFKHFFSRQFA